MTIHTESTHSESKKQYSEAIMQKNLPDND
jgi:hypothetical protein